MQFKYEPGMRVCDRNNQQKIGTVIDISIEQTRVEWPKEYRRYWGAKSDPYVWVDNDTIIPDTPEAHAWMKNYVNTLEQEFTATFNSVHDQIQEKLVQASRLISEAEDLAERNGVPFRPKTTIMFCRPSYIPESMKNKWAGLDTETISNIANAYSGGDYDGWQQSQVC